eukprot:TCONS_00051272-protein
MENEEVQQQEGLNVDGFLKMVGEYGVYQKMLNVIFGLLQIPFALSTFIMYFIALEPEWRCVANSTVCQLNGTFTNENTLRCQIQRSEWEFTKPKEYSIIVDYDLVCGNTWFINMLTSVIFIGALISAIVLGWYSDNYGRKRISYVLFLMVILSNFLIIYTPGIGWFIALRFVAGIANFGIPSYFVMINEVVGNRHRAFAGNLYWVFYAGALCILSLQAYLIESWKTLVITCTLPYLLLIFTYLFVPESVRWLRLKEHANEALDIFRLIAKWNGRDFDSNATLSKASKLKEKTNPLDLFRTKKMALTSTILFICLYTNSLVYFGISLAASDLGTGSIYLNFFLISIVEIPGNIAATYICNRYGRKKSSTIPLALAGLVTLAVSLTPKNIFRIILGILGKFFITISFDCVSTLIVEAYPTNIRTAAMSTLGLAIYIGGASAPWIAKGLTQVSPESPFYVMGALGLFSGIMCFLLPETRGVSMKETSVDVVDGQEDSAADSIESHNICLGERDGLLNK